MRKEWYKNIMQVPRESIAIQQAAGRLAEICGVPDLAEDASFQVRTDDDCVWDAVLRNQEHLFVLEWKRSGSLGYITEAIHKLRAAQSSFPQEVTPILAVPYMGKAGQERCEDAELPWLDLSGNARIVVPSIFYQNLGNPNQFRRPGRPESPFGTKGSRIARQLLIEPSRPQTQRAIASIVGLNEGHTSRVIGKLLEAGLVQRGNDGIRVTDRGTLLDAWREDYRFDRHQVIRGHISTSGGDSLTRSIAEVLSSADVPYAVTGLAAAWLLTRHAGFRLSTVYLSRPPSLGVKSDLGFREEPRGANTWLVTPNDEGVFHGAEVVNGIRCVHPVQAYLDLKSHPERATEAAEELRKRLLSGDVDDL